MNTNATGQPIVHGPVWATSNIRTFVFGQFPALHVEKCHNQAGNGRKRQKNVIMGQKTYDGPDSGGQS